MQSIITIGIEWTEDGLEGVVPSLIVAKDSHDQEVTARLLVGLPGPSRYHYVSKLEGDSEPQSASTMLSFGDVWLGIADHLGVSGDMANDFMALDLKSGDAR